MSFWKKAKLGPPYKYTVEQQLDGSPFEGSSFYGWKGVVSRRFDKADYGYMNIQIFYTNTEEEARAEACRVIQQDLLKRQYKAERKTYEYNTEADCA